MDIYKVTNITKYRSFQYRLIQRGIVTNTHLSRWGIISSNLCSFCHSEQETLIHLFYSCTLIQELWDKVIRYLGQRFAIQTVIFTAKNVMLNRIIPCKSSIGNFICLVTKQFIYKQRCLKKPAYFPLLKWEIEKIEKIEKYKLQ